MIRYFLKKVLKKTPEFGVLFKGMSIASLGRSQLPESFSVSAGVFAVAKQTNFDQLSIAMIFSVRKSFDLTVIILKCPSK